MHAPQAIYKATWYRGGAVGRAARCRAYRTAGVVAARTRWGEEPGAERIRDLRAGGRSLQFIAREVGCSPATVLRALQGVSCHPEDYSRGDRGAA